jgi:hypothetical protein
MESSLHECESEALFPAIDVVQGASARLVLVFFFFFFLVEVFHVYEIKKDYFFK